MSRLEERKREQNRSRARLGGVHVELSCAAAAWRALHVRSRGCGAPGRAHGRAGPRGRSEAPHGLPGVPAVRQRLAGAHIEAPLGGKGRANLAGGGPGVAGCRCNEQGGKVGEVGLALPVRSGPAQPPPAAPGPSGTRAWPGSAPRMAAPGRAPRQPPGHPVAGQQRGGARWGGAAS